MSIGAAARAACRDIAAGARHVRVDADAIPAFARSLGTVDPYPPPAVDLPGADAETRAALILVCDAINFGSGWFPTLRKRDGKSGSLTVMLGVRDRFAARGAWTPDELAAMTAAEIAEVTGQDPDHELMALYAAHLRELGERTRERGLLALATRPALAEHLATWPTFSDPPFFKRAQLTAYDVVCAGLAPRGAEGDLTLFADNLVPHVLRLEGVLSYEPALAGRIERGELLEHGSDEEVEIRACGLHAVELIVAERPDLSAPAVDALLWHRGQDPRYKAVPRHRSRNAAY